MSEQAGGDPAAKPASKHSHRKKDGEKRSREKLIGGKVLGWVAGIVGSVIATFAATYLTTVSGTASAHTTPPALGGWPVKVTVGNVAGHDDSFAFPEPLTLTSQQIRQLNSARGTVTSSVFDRWYSAHRGAYVGAVTIQLNVQGNRRHTVKIINITPVENCSAPLNGTMFYFPGQGSDLSTRLYVDLDDRLKPDAYAPGPSSKKYPDYFGRYTVPLGYRSQDTFQVTASTNNQYCAFKLALTVIDNGKKTVETVDDDGQPFRLTSLPERGNQITFSSYRVLYLNFASPGFNPNGPPWVRGNPKTYNQ